jgi:hypothetical protein
MHKLKVAPINLPTDVPAAMKRLRKLNSEHKALQLGQRVMSMFQHANKDFTAPVEHVGLLPEGGSYEDLLLECLGKLEDAIVEALEEQVPFVLSKQVSVDA